LFTNSVLFFVFVKVIEEIVDFLLNLDRDGVIKSNVVLRLNGGTTNQGNKRANQNNPDKIAHNPKITPTGSHMQPSIENNSKRNEGRYSNQC